MKNPIKIAAISGIAIIIIYFLLLFLGIFIKSPILFSLLGIVISIATVFFFYGFFVIGKKYHGNLLKGMSIYFIAISLIFLLMSVPLSYYIKNPSFFGMQELKEKLEQLDEEYGGRENIPEDVLRETLESSKVDFLFLAKILIVIYLITFLFYGVPSILFGVGLLKLGERARYAKTVGIFSIIGGATSIIVIGYFILPIAFILGIVFLFSEANKPKAA